MRKIKSYKTVDQIEKCCIFRSSSGFNDESTKQVFLAIIRFFIFSWDYFDNANDGIMHFNLDLSRFCYDFYKLN